VLLLWIFYSAQIFLWARNSPRLGLRVRHRCGAAGRWPVWKEITLVVRLSRGLPPLRHVSAQQEVVSFLGVGDTESGTTEETRHSGGALMMTAAGVASANLLTTGPGVAAPPVRKQSVR
jgi:hypothetical protein